MLEINRDRKKTLTLLISLHVASYFYRKIVLLLLGLDNAGKTAAVRGLAGEPPDTVPTVGFSVISLNYLDYTVKIYDLGGGSGIRGIWPQYFVDVTHKTCI